MALLSDAAGGMSEVPTKNLIPTRPKVAPCWCLTPCVDSLPVLLGDLMGIDLDFFSQVGQTESWSYTNTTLIDAKCHSLLTAESRIQKSQKSKFPMSSCHRGLPWVAQRPPPGLAGSPIYYMGEPRFLGDPRSNECGSSSAKGPQGSAR